MWILKFIMIFCGIVVIMIKNDDKNTIHYFVFNVCNCMAVIERHNNLSTTNTNTAFGKHSHFKLASSGCHLL